MKRRFFAFVTIAIISLINVGCNNDATGNVKDVDLGTDSENNIKLEHQSGNSEIKKSGRNEGITYGKPGNYKRVTISEFENCLKTASKRKTSYFEVIDLTNKSLDRFFILLRKYKGQIALKLSGNISAIGDNDFCSCKNLVSVILPKGVISIGNESFSECIALKHVSLPEGVTKIGNYAFYGCTKLNNVTFPGSLTEIGMGAFENCNNMSDITIPMGVISLGSRVFANCANLGSVTFADPAGWYGMYEGKEQDLSKIIKDHKKASEFLKLRPVLLEKKIV